MEYFRIKISKGKDVLSGQIVTKKELDQYLDSQPIARWLEEGYAISFSPCFKSPLFTKKQKP